MDLILPFKVGDTIESRSYSAGYRGAWFRCKITYMCIRSGHMECQVEYIDYPDEKRRWNRLYKVPPKCHNQKSGQNREIMIRPPFPQWCWENDIPEHGSQLDVVAVVSSSWKVGDLIDWWYTGCFWTGRITELLGDDRVKIVCPEKPLGEGGCYDAELKDLRPALDWSLEKGWSTPLSQENGECWHTARLIAGNQDTGSSSSDEEDIEQSCDGKKELQRCLNGSFDTPEQEIGKCFNEASDTPEELVDPDVKRPANTNGRCCMQSQIHGEEERQKCMNEEPDTSPKVIDSKLQLAPNEIGECCTNSQEDFPASPAEEPQKCMSEEPDTSPDVIDSKVQLAPNEIGECCMNSQADFPMSPAANSGKSPRYLTDGQSSPPSFKKLKASSDHDASVEPTDTVGEAMMDLERLANKIRRAQELLRSVDYAPSNIVLAPWKFLENNPSAKHN